MIQLLEHILASDNILEFRGERIIKDAFYSIHYNEDMLEGVFWYNYLTRETPYLSGQFNHASFPDHIKYRQTDGWVRGRVGKANGKFFIFLYVDDFPTRTLNGEVIQQLWNDVSDTTKLTISYIIDEGGHQLLTEAHIIK